MIRVDAMWLAVDPVDMRVGAERLLARVVQVFGAAQAQHGYLFAKPAVLVAVDATDPAAGSNAIGRSAR